MKPPSFRLALAQMRVQPGEKARNLSRASEIIHEAAKGGAQIVLLPEAMNLGWMHPTSLADEIPGGESFLALAKAARESKVQLCAGLIERAGGQTFNSAILLDPRGELLAHHRKINELQIAHELYSPGDRLTVVETAFGKIGIMMCADAFIQGQVITRALATMGAQIILSPCAWAVPPNHSNELDPYGGLWVENYTPVARERGVWIAAASSVGPIKHGPWSAWTCIGSSLVVAPNGEVLLRGPYGPEAETILYVDVTLREAKRPVGEPGRW